MHFYYICILRSECYINYKTHTLINYAPSGFDWSETEENW